MEDGTFVAINRDKRHCTSFLSFFVVAVLVAVVVALDFAA